jgi:plasmid stability protein
MTIFSARSRDNPGTKCPRTPITPSTRPAKKTALPSPAHDSKEHEEQAVANLLVRGVDEAIVKALKARAFEHGQSAEAEHRAILVAALAGPRKRSFAEILASMPDVGTDADFKRLNSVGKDSPIID